MSKQQYKCPCCGSMIPWDGAEQHVKCKGCDNNYYIVTLQEYSEEQRLNSSEEFSWERIQDSEFLEDVSCYECVSCTARIALKDRKDEPPCPFCGSKTARNNELKLELPDLVLPFKKDKAAAKKAFSGFCKGKLLLPGGFAAERSANRIQPVYVPAWVFECTVNGKARYDGVKEKRWHDSVYEYEKSDHSMALREGSAIFEDIRQSASAVLDDSRLAAVAPFDMSEAEPLRKDDLKEYPAELYAVSYRDVQDKAAERASKGMNALLRSTVKGFDTAEQEYSAMKSSEGKVRYALLPVWVLTTKYRNKTYCFLMNGNSGRYSGTLPFSKAKLVGLFFAVTAAVGLLGTAVTLLFF